MTKHTGTKHSEFTRRKILALSPSLLTGAIAPNLFRTSLLASVSAPVLLACSPNTYQDVVSTAGRTKFTPLDLHDIRLKPSIFLTALNTNTKYLLSLSADRFLHNFHKSAGLPPKGDCYGGWEACGIAGHSIGHYISALALMFASTGNETMRDRIRYIVQEFALCQNAHGDGYVGGTTVERDGEVMDGKIIFEELRAGDVRTGGFDINGGWVPLYTWHKVHAALIDAVKLADIAEAKPVLMALSVYLADILDDLNEEQMQKLLASEFGGLNESYADLYAMTGETRWLDLAKRLHHDVVLDPLMARDNPLPGLHANTQIPKIIGMARLYALSGEEQYAQGAKHFLTLVRDHYSYVIGGNSDREHFGQPDQLSQFITDRTCEACNSYNMMKLAKHVYSWSGDASLFDYYERMHLNHIMAHQHPGHGGFVYFMPLSSGSKRIYSEPEDSFWCCVGSGMESHSKHAEAAYWQSTDGLFVNLYMPSQFTWQDGGMEIEVQTKYPMDDVINFTLTTVTKANAGQSTDLHFRLPSWIKNEHDAKLSINGQDTKITTANGYIKLNKDWKSGDQINLHLPMALHVETMTDDASITAFLHGPLVLGANLGPAATPYDALAPALVGANQQGGTQQLAKPSPTFATYVLPSTKPAPVTLSPFFNQYDNRSAVYFETFSARQWSEQSAQFIAEQKRLKQLAKRTIDVMHLGEMQPERDHDFRFNHADMLAFGGKTGRQAWWGVGNWMAFDLSLGRPSMGENQAQNDRFILDVLYWGEEINKTFDLHINGQHLHHETRNSPPVKKFVNVQYDLPISMTKGRSTIEVKFTTKGSDAPVYECRILRAPS